MTATPLKSPFPYFGGKSKVADLVWERLGDPDNFVEPFAGSSAVLMRRPQPGKIETINDANHYVVNFWRAVKADPGRVAEYCDHPVTEADLHARHRYLMLGAEAVGFRDSIERDPEFCDAKFAGWWVWGQSCWIGGGWCDTTGLTVKGDSELRSPDLFRPKGVVTDSVDVHMQRPMMESQTGVHSRQVPDLAGDGGATGRGVVASSGHNRIKMPRLDSRGEGGGVTSKMPLLNSHDGKGTGVHTLSRKRPMTVLGNSEHLPGVNGDHLSGGRPQLGDAFDIGRGVCSNGETRLCDGRRAWLVAWMHRLADRLRMVRVLYGHWSRICGSNTTMVRLGVTGAFLDPPYAKNLDRLAAWIKHLKGEGPAPDAAGGDSNRSGGLYSGDESQDVDRLVAQVQLWAREWGSHPKVRIALCGYEGEHDALEQLGWDVVEWQAHGGYGNRNAENQNKHRERIWFSPACLSGDGGQQSLF